MCTALKISLQLNKCSYNNLSVCQCVCLCTSLSFFRTVFVLYIYKTCLSVFLALFYSLLVIVSLCILSVYGQFVGTPVCLYLL